MALNTQERAANKVKSEAGRSSTLAWTHTETLGSPGPANLFSYMPDTVF